MSYGELEGAVRHCDDFCVQEGDIATLLDLDNYQISMKRSVKQLDAFLRFCQVQAATNDDVRKEWLEFSRIAGSPANLVEECDPPGTQEEAEEQRRAAQLGQYFCSVENAKQIVDTVICSLQDRLGSKPDSKTKQTVLVLEPSCGNGDIVWQLMRSMHENDAVAAVVDRVVAYDLDETVVKACRKKQADDESELPVPVSWFAADFLHTQFPGDVDADDITHVVVVGGPPYTSGAGSGSSMTVDLPEKFLYHCVEEWKASFVAFLLPNRYEDFEWNLNPDEWEIETRNLQAGSTFFFRGKDPVTQPSILLLCQRNQCP